MNRKLNPALLKMHEFRLWMFDADGVLRHCKVDGKPCPNVPDEQVINPRAVQFFARHDIPRWGIASNQMGVSLGYLTEQAAMDMLRLTADALGGLPAEFIRMCPDNDEYRRKPAPGMLQELMELAVAPPAESVFIGDMESDRQAALNAGCHFIHVDELFGMEYGVMGQLLNLAFYQRALRDNDLRKATRLVDDLLERMPKPVRGVRDKNAAYTSVREYLQKQGANPEYLEAATQYFVNEILWGLLNGCYPSNEKRRWLLSGIAGNMTPAAEVDAA